MSHPEQFTVANVDSGVDSEGLVYQGPYETASVLGARRAPQRASDVLNIKNRKVKDTDRPKPVQLKPPFKVGIREEPSRRKARLDAEARLNGGDAERRESSATTTTVHRPSKALPKRTSRKATTPPHSAAPPPALPSPAENPTTPRAWPLPPQSPPAQPAAPLSAAQMDFDFLDAQPVTLQRLLTAASQQAPVYAMANELLLPSRESAPPAPHPPTPRASVPRASIPHAPTPRASVPRASTPHASALHAPTPHAPAPHTSAPHAPAPHASVPHAYAPHPLEGQNNPTAPNTMPTMPPLGLGPLPSLLAPGCWLLW
ncbi:hypothetical protein C8Q74DRAFT_1364191 [Fomes fomentarius]|nr:hypothetical protein C8Q74DRAFT_1364191 [Fomes fomentarius]